MTDKPNSEDPVSALFERIKASGLSLSEVCRRADVALSTVKRWKAGTSEPQFRVYRKIIQVLAAAEIESCSWSKVKSARPRQRSGTS
ncbi:helix-turn-helix transcriptional regulator [Azospirillum sp. Sh1]|uniref:helix-turn-helix domain-containing protein n=1 Tax=Azospirillum sp. Sh1 TaxID=2607285 RepID=UPI0011ECF4C6|nr:helix-turn-helix transcriptional regulator [Azospirillum sp. Sh1]KAA0576702.1 helix-turn-helix transcriptional regulator [Azospirillum sp. Sh1]